MVKKIRKGWKCEKQSDGSQECTRIEQDDNGNKYSTGTKIGIAIDNDTCEPIFSGDTNEMMDDDSEDISKIASRQTSKCKDRKNRGL